MTALGRTTIAILGAGKGGTALLELFTHLPEIEILGIADQVESSPGMVYARQLKIPATHDPLSLIRRPGINLIMNVTGDLTIDQLITTHKHPETEVLGGAASKVLWDLIRHQSQTQSQLFQAEKLAGMGTFASGIAHDINNPLYILLAFAENILEETDIPTIHEQARSIIDAGKRIQGICQNITHYARDKKYLNPVPVNVDDKLKEALNIARYATVLQDLSIVRNFDEKFEVLANPDELLQVFVNLMTNAIQAMDGRGTLTLSTWCQDGIAKISISDTGRGIPKENLEKIFEPFFTTKPPGKGTGLGLHNVKEIIKKYQGDLNVESQVGSGTTFTIEFPNSAII
ncbi:MAG: GHKL domain-containing protein [Nitrospirota bacterium]|nr:MAG: GHKL domain-containing protein [Nitrospirota bacterium]